MSANLSPYTPVEKVPLRTDDNMRSRGYSVRLQDEEAKSGWEEVGLVSEDYLLVPNREVRDMALEIAHQSPFEWQEEKTHFDGKRFAYALAAKSSIAREVKVGDVISIGMLFQNSYDGSLKLSASRTAFSKQKSTPLGAFSTRAPASSGTGNEASATMPTTNSSPRPSRSLRWKRLLKAGQKLWEVSRLMQSQGITPLGALDLLLEELRYFEELDRECERIKEADYPHWLL